jgi:hypothetical protein
MALLVLLSTVSFTVESHYCGGILVDSSLFGHVETCGMQIQQKPSSSACKITKKDCCSDEKLIVDGQNNLNISIDKLSIDKQVFVTSFIYSYIKLFEGIENNVTSYDDYAPPLVIRQLYKLDETFLI